MKQSPVTDTHVRPATPEDMPRIRDLHAETEKRIGMQMDLPDVSDHAAVLGFWVVEHGGKIVKAFYLEKCIEYVEVGTDPLSAGTVWRFQNILFNAARAKGTRFIHCLIPPALDGWLVRLIFRALLWLQTRTARRIGAYLKEAQFQQTGFIHYSRRLR